MYRYKIIFLIMILALSVASCTDKNEQIDEVLTNTVTPYIITPTPNINIVTTTPENTLYEIQVDNEEKRMMNIFLSCFAEGFLQHYDRNHISDKDLISFAVLYDWINNYDLFIEAGNYKAKISKDDIEATIYEYFGLTDIVHQSIDEIMYNDDYYFIEQATGEMMSFVQIEKISKNNNNEYVVEGLIYDNIDNFYGDPYEPKENWTDDQSAEVFVGGKINAVFKKVVDNQVSRYILLKYDVFYQPEDVSQVTEVPHPTEALLENSEDASQETDDETHLEFYDEIDEYNSSQVDYKGFILSEVWIDGEPFYQFLNETKDIKIVVDQTQENATIYHDGKSMDYDMGYLFDDAHLSTEIELCDVTSDEEDELIIYHSYVGFGTYDTYCDVINLSSMTLYNIEPYFEQLCSKITVEPIRITEDDSIVCRITDINGNVSYGTAMGCGSSNLSDYSFGASENTSCSVNADNEKKCLSVGINITLSDIGFICSLGGISADLIFNTNTNCFELSDDFEVSIDNIYNDEAFETISPID